MAYTPILRSHHREIPITQPVVMGILNITPDSFFGGSRYTPDSSIEIAAENMLSAGALILDIGGQSSRPGSERISAEEEWQRIENPLKKIRKSFPEAWISIDTYYASVAARSIEQGADIINDISFGSDDSEMFSVLSKQPITYIGMHKKGNPKNMQDQANYHHVVSEVVEYLLQRKTLAYQCGIETIWLDPGFGFGKTLEQNYDLLNALNTLCEIDSQVLVGVSRKSMIYKLLQNSPEEALNGTSYLHAIALEKGAKILRVHDVKEAVECVKLHQALHQGTKQ